MPQLSLSDFVRIALSNDQIAKINKIKNIKYRPPYSPATDYWKPLRDTIIETHENDLSKENIDSVLPAVSNNKIVNYTETISNYKAWWGRKHFEWFQPCGNIFSMGGVDINVNPELGLIWDENRFLIKLYFNAEPMTSRHAEIIILLMQEALSPICKNATTAVLDIPRKRLLTTINNAQLLQLGLQGEISFIATVWNNI